jgi:hypothetical protein
MRNRFAGLGSYVHGVATSRDTGWIVMAMDDVGAKGVEHSAIMKWDRPLLKPHALKMFRSKFTAWLPGRREAIFVGDDGQCAVLDASNTLTDEFVTAGTRNPRNVGHIRGGARLGDEIIVVGMQRQVYRRNAAGQWIDFDHGLPHESVPVSGFEAVVALGPDEMYAAGWDGEIWMFDGRTWTAVDSPTNSVLTSLCKTKDGTVFGCGRKGLLIRGRGQHWRRLVDTACPDDLWSVAYFKGELFAASLRRLYRLIGGETLEPIDLDELGADSFGVLAPMETVLWSIGEKDVLEFDGSRWTRVA